MSPLQTRIFVATAAIIAIASFSVSAASEFLTYAQTLASNGIINPQSSEAGYLLQENLLRAQAVKLSLGTAGLGQRDCRTLSSLTFSDVNTSMGDLCGFIEGAVANNIITKTDKFFPYQPISRSEFAEIIVRAFDVSNPGAIRQTNLSYFSDVPSWNKFANAVNRLADTSCLNVSNDGITALNFRPSDSITRGESFKIMACLLGERNRSGDSGTTNTGIVVEGYTYHWQTSSYGSCSKTCGEGVQTRTVTCQRSDGVTVADSFCGSAGTTKPATQQLCNLGICSGTSSNTPSYASCSIAGTNTYYYRIPTSTKCYDALFTCKDGQLTYGTQFSPAPPQPSIGTQLYQNSACNTAVSGIVIAPAVTSPTASILLNGVKNGTNKVGQTYTRSWSSTNANSWSSTYRFSGSSCAKNGVTGAWQANTANGSSVSTAYGPEFANCTLTITYTATNTTTGLSTTDTATLTILPTDIPVSTAPTATLTANGSKNISINVGQTVASAGKYNRTWSSTNANKWSFTNKMSGPSCAMVSGTNPWQEYTANGEIPNLWLTPEYANCTLTTTFTATNTTTGLSATDTITINFLPAGAQVNTGSTIACLGKNIESLTEGLLTQAAIDTNGLRSPITIRSTSGINPKFSDTKTYPHPTFIIPKKQLGSAFSFSVEFPIDWEAMKLSADKKYILFHGKWNQYDQSREQLPSGEAVSLSLTPGDFTNAVYGENVDAYGRGKAPVLLIPVGSVNKIYFNFKTTNFRYIQYNEVTTPGMYGLDKALDLTTRTFTEDELKLGLLSNPNISTSTRMKFFGTGNWLETASSKLYSQCVSSLIDSGNLSALTNQSNGSNNNGTTTPTASILLNGVKNGTNKVGQTYTRSWSSTNANSWSSTYRFSGSSCAKNGVTGAWQANTANGSSVSTAYGPEFANCTLTITYTATNTTTGLSTTDTATLNIFPANATDPVPTSYGSCSNNGVTSTMYYRMSGSTKCEGALFSCTNNQLTLGTQFSPAPPTPLAGTTIYKYSNCSNTAPVNNLTISNPTSTIDLTTGTTASTIISNIAQENTLACTEILNAGTSTTIKSNAGYCNTAANFIQRTPSTEWQYNGTGWNVNYNKYSTNYMNTPGLKMAYYIKDKVSGKQVVWYLNVTASSSNNNTLPTTACSTTNWQTLGTFSCDAQNKQIQTISSCLPSGYDNPNLWNWNKTTNTFSHMTGYSCDGIAHGGYPATANPATNNSTTTVVTTYLGAPCSSSDRLGPYYYYAGGTCTSGAIFTCYNNQISLGTQFSPAPPMPMAGAMLYGNSSCR